MDGAVVDDIIARLLEILEEDTVRLNLAFTEKGDISISLTTEFEGLLRKLHGYIDTREQLLTTTLEETHLKLFQQLELSPSNERQ